MNKAILVIDMPNGGIDCDCVNMCHGTFINEEYREHRPDWCPLKPFQLGKELRKFRKTIKDKNTLIGFNMAVAICNKYLGEEK